MRPIILRRLKRQVAKSIPAMKETVIDVELTTLQKQYYRAIFEKNREFLYRGCAGHVPQLINVEMELRKCCQHPFLLSGVEESEAERIKDAIMAGESLGTLDDLMLEEEERMEKEASLRKQRQDDGLEEDSDESDMDDGSKAFSYLEPEAKRKRKKFKKQDKILPDGWTRTEEERMQGKSKGTFDTYYFSPDNQRFRSIREVERFLGVELPTSTVKDTKENKHENEEDNKKKVTFDKNDQNDQNDKNETTSSSSFSSSTSLSNTDAAAAAIIAIPSASSSSDSISSSSSSSSKTALPPPPLIIETIAPEFYDDFPGDWCKYCGARDTSGWNTGPWGSRTLCVVHYVQWRQKKTLDLEEWKDTMPVRPIAPEKNTEWKYKHFKLLRERMVAKTAKSRTKTMLSRRQKKKKQGEGSKNKLIMDGCEIVLRKIAYHRLAAPFLQPVNLEDYPDYKTMVRKPMDLSTIYKKVKGYKPVKPYNGNKVKFARDMRLVFRNCLVYNDHGSQINDDSEVLAKLFENWYRVWVEDTSRTQFDDVLLKLPEIPGVWLGIGLDQEEDDDDDDEEEVDEVEKQDQKEEEEDDLSDVSEEAVRKRNERKERKEERQEQKKLKKEKRKKEKDTPLRRLIALKNNLQRDRAHEHRILTIKQELEDDEELVINEIQLRELHKLDDLQLKIKNQIALVTRTEEIMEDKVDRGVLQRMIDCSGKLVLIDKLLPKLRNEGRKVLIFSQFKLVLDILVRYFNGRGYPYERIDGGVHGNERQASIDRFCDPNSDSFIFILSTKAGGVGINLTAADTVIIYDSDWNPQNDLQATARCHRIGQTKEVTTYRLVTRNTYEGEMFARASRKLGLERAVMSGSAEGQTSLFDDASGTGRNEDSNITNELISTKMSGVELEKLLKQGAYAVLGEDGAEKSRKFHELDIDTILENSSREVVHNPEGYNEKDKTSQKHIDSTENGVDFMEGMELNNNDSSNTSTNPHVKKRGRGRPPSSAASSAAASSTSSTSSTSSSSSNSASSSSTSSSSTSSVSMQSFTSAGADTSLNVDDADFWNKLMPGMQSARGLMSRLSDGAATATEESKANFIDELSTLVSEILEAKRNGDDVSSHEWDTTKQMVSFMKKKF